MKLPLSPEFCLFTVLLLLVNACVNDAATDRLSQERKRATEATAHLVKEHGAVMGWDKNFKFSAYSVDLEKELVRRDQRPVLLTGPIMDVRQDSISPIVLLEHGSINALALNLVATLRCSSEQVAQIRAVGGPLPPSFAVIAEITSVAPAQPLRVELALGEEAEWIANGRCIDLAPIGFGGELFVYPAKR